MSQTASVISKLVQEAIAGTVDTGAVSVLLPAKIGLRVVRQPDHLHVTWDTNPEVDMWGPINPDLTEVRLYADRAEIDTTVATLKVKY